MALRGKGALAIWNGMNPGADAEFIEWHVKEHIPERVGLPGFISGRRYTAIDGHPAYFNFYEVDTTATLRSDAYLARLNNPSAWTRRVVAEFVDTSRTICHVVVSEGLGVAAFAEVLRFDRHDDSDRARAFVRGLAGERGCAAAHLFVREGGPPIETSETRLRGAPDLTWAAVLIVEAAGPEAALALREGVLSDDALGAAGFAAPAGRGLYRLDYALTHAELAGEGASITHAHEEQHA